MGRGASGYTIRNRFLKTRESFLCVIYELPDRQLLCWRFFTKNKDFLVLKIAISFFDVILMELMFLNLLKG